jgi:diaminopimelate decarboxylase
MEPDRFPLHRIADLIGTPYYLYDGAQLREKLTELRALTDGPHLCCRYALKANSARRVLSEIQAAGLWADAVSGNEVLRAVRAGFPAGNDPPVIMLTSDVFRGNALTTILEHGVLPNVGSPGMVRELRDAGYRGPIAVRANPGFGHGHVQAVDTGGPSSKHGIWYDDLAAVRASAAEARLPIVALHVHVGTGPQPGEFDANMRKVIDFYESMLPEFPEVTAVNFGGGLPHAYRSGTPAYDLRGFRAILLEAVERLRKAAGRPIRIEVEPGRYPVAGMGLLVARVKDIKRTRDNTKGPGHTFVMVDAGFNDLVRPAMYGSYHHISIVGAGASRTPEPLVVAGPLCESGDVFTRDDHELLVPRSLPRPDPGDLLVLHDTGAYGASMSSNYVSFGRPPQVFWDEGKAMLIARRETIEDVTRAECEESVIVD